MLNNFSKSGRRKEKRVGRGGKRGTTAGRGTKGQRSRSGHRIRPAERDLIIRIPKRRGFRNKAKSDAAAILNLGDLRGGLKAMVQEAKGRVLSPDVLKEAGVLPLDFRGRVKLLGGGEVDFALTVKGMSVSESAKAKILKAGGRIIANQKEDAKHAKI